MFFRQSVNLAVYIEKRDGSASTEAMFETSNVLRRCLRTDFSFGSRGRRHHCIAAQDDETPLEPQNPPVNHRSPR